jgi:hypothetical protein
MGEKPYANNVLRTERKEEQSKNFGACFHCAIISFKTVILNKNLCLVSTVFVLDIIPFYKYLESYVRISVIKACNPSYKLILLWSNFTQN